MLGNFHCVNTSTVANFKITEGGDGRRGMQSLPRAGRNQSSTGPDSSPRAIPLSQLPCHQHIKPQRSSPSASTRFCILTPRQVLSPEHAFTTPAGISPSRSRLPEAPVLRPLPDVGVLGVCPWLCFLLFRRLSLGTFPPTPENHYL